MTDMHTVLPFLLAMIAAIVFLNLLAARLKVAYPILLVVAGLLVSFVPGLPRMRINPDLIFFIFLPPLLFTTEMTIDVRRLMDEIHGVLLLAIVAVVLERIAALLALAVRAAV